MSTTATAAESRALTDAINRLRRVLRQSVRSEIAWESLPMAQVEVLQAVAAARTVRVQDLVASLRLAQSTVSQLLGKLVGDGYVTRDTDPADRRVAAISLTAEGREVLKRWDAAHRRRVATALDRLPGADRDAILAAVPALQRLADALGEA